MGAIQREEFPGDVVTVTKRANRYLRAIGRLIIPLLPSDFSCCAAEPAVWKGAICAELTEGVCCAGTDIFIWTAKWKRAVIESCGRESIFDRAGRGSRASAKGDKADNSASGV